MDIPVDGAVSISKIENRMVVENGFGWKIQTPLQLLLRASLSFLGTLRKEEEVGRYVAL